MAQSLTYTEAEPRLSGTTKDSLGSASRCSATTLSLVGAACALAFVAGTAPQQSASKLYATSAPSRPITAESVPTAARHPSAVARTTEMHHGARKQRLTTAWDHAARWKSINLQTHLWTEDAATRKGSRHAFASSELPQELKAISMVAIALSGATYLLRAYGRWVVKNKLGQRLMYPLWNKPESGESWSQVMASAAAAYNEDSLEDDELHQGEVVPSPPLITLSAVEDLFIGAVAGIAKIMLAMPLLTWKFKVQAGAALPTTIGEWYRGAFVQAGAVTPIASLQMVVNGALSRVISGASPWSDTLKRELSYPERLLAALGAGVVTAMIYTPVDLLTIQQQQLGTNAAGAAAYIIQNCGIFGMMRGALAMSIREGIFTLGMLGLTPIVGEWLSKQFAWLRDSPILTNIAGSICAGVTAAVLTHPMDTIKTQIQIDLMGETYTNIVSTTLLLIQNEGWGYLFLGALPRTMMICISFFIAATLRQAYMATKVSAMEVEGA